MLKRSDVAWGIDLGDQGLKAVKLTRQGGIVRIEQIQKIPYETIEPDPDSVERSRHIRTALTEFMETAKPKKHEKIGVAIPGRSAFNRTIPLPPVEEKRIPDIVKYEAQQLIPFPIDEVIWDYQRLGENDMEELEVTLFAVKTQIIFSYLASLQAAKVPVDVIQVAPLALYNFVQYDRHPEGSTIVVDIGAGNADLVLVDGDRFWNRPLPYSGDDITQALEEKFQIGFEEAEDLKVNSATSKQADKLFNVMRPVLGDMVSEIHRSIGYYKSQTRNVKFEQMVLMGNSFKLKGMTEFFAQHLDYGVEVLDRLESIEVGGELDPTTLQVELSSYAVALGLGLQALGVGPININMLPREERIQKIINKKKPYGIGVAAILAAMIGASYYAHTERAQELEKSLTIAPRVIKVVTDDETKYESIRSEAGPAEAQINEVAGIGLGRDYWPLVINELLRALPEGDCLLVELEAGVKAKEEKSSGAGPVSFGPGGPGATGAGPAATRMAAAEEEPDTVGMKLVLDVVHPKDPKNPEEYVEDYVVLEKMKSGFEKMLKGIPIFEGVKRKSPEGVSLKVGLLRELEGASKAKKEAEAEKKEEDQGSKEKTPAAAEGAGEAGASKAGGGRLGNRTRPGGGPREARPTGAKEKKADEKTEEVYKETIKALRFTYTWTVKNRDALHGTKEWWGLVVRLVRNRFEEEKFEDAMDSLWNFQATSPDFGNDDEVRNQVLAELKKLEPKLGKERPQYKKCETLLKRLDPGWTPETHAGVTSPAANTVN